MENVRLLIGLVMILLWVRKTDRFNKVYDQSRKIRLLEEELKRLQSAEVDYRTPYPQEAINELRIKIAEEEKIWSELP